MVRVNINSKLQVINDPPVKLIMLLVVCFLSLVYILYILIQCVIK